ncbi:DNA topoisomerase IV subunit B [Enhydrobacter sp.]|jgi:topoisomerase-4 subunit B|uniref:DNA topoisomerase IV subunit B n=1 Tax=Enhydrobacter sp. TaxID=1894999 RepID=UPI0026385392|nr:DNA topoisomerase IV subunit B [Enhydrobacter sp.]WIM13854.1 MAG: DNA topoisomerase IV subunit B [Enhydrobacter sp.]
MAKNGDLFERPGGKRAAAGKDSSYTAHDIEVLEGLEPVRKRPGMYIGGTDERAMHHLVAEVLDNAMDEAVAGHADTIHLELLAGNKVLIRDNGRGIPVDPHPKFKNRSALEIILTTLHSGGKFNGKVYATSGGLHGVGVSVVNALSDELAVEVARDRQSWTQSFSRGKPTSKLKANGAAPNRRGTTVVFHPDPEIFGKLAFVPERLYRMARSKSYLFRGVEIRWKCDKSLLKGDTIPEEESFHFAGGLKDYLISEIGERATVVPQPFAGEARSETNGTAGGKVEWAVWWPTDEEGFVRSYCNTVPTSDGGTHESGFRSALVRGLKRYAELTGSRKGSVITADDVMDGAAGLVSVFIEQPQFQGQTKEKLVSVEATKLVETVVGDNFEHWLTGDKEVGNVLLEHVIAKAEERLRRKQDREQQRKTATRKLRLPGKLADCSNTAAEGTEIFLVEGDSAGGSAKAARNRETQAILPLRGKILNVASASADKLRDNQEVQDLIQALGCGTGNHYNEDRLRYERVIIMTDADVDGAHIASLLMTFFYREMPKLIENGHLFLAQPPLYRLSKGGRTEYARDEAHKEELVRDVFGGGKIDITRFKGLGEMQSVHLRETTMDAGKRTLLKIDIPTAADAEQRREAMRTASLVEDLMGRKPEKRYAFIQENAKFARDLDV